MDLQAAVKNNKEQVIVKLIEAVLKVEPKV